ncbi:MAG TPA: type II toxin-antitoxin system HicA family toxin [Candidatus Thermoplasmatota archaeon]|nr:type II toxin-antitoxin system HicA family toxin [Candidatus Thermoplasmatota archaeon]
MSPRIGPLPYRKVARALEKAGFRPVRQAGSHVRFQHPDGRGATVPRHPGQDIDPWLLRKILRESGLSVDEFQRWI